MGGLELDAGTRGPVVDAALRTSWPGVFAAGNPLHGAEQADVAALGGRHARRSRATRDGSWPERRVPVLCRAPLAWVSPNALSSWPARLRAPASSSARASSSPTRASRSPRTGRALWSGRLARPARPLRARLPDGWIGRAPTPTAGP